MQTRRGLAHIAESSSRRLEGTKMPTSESESMFGPHLPAASHLARALNNYEPVNERCPNHPLKGLDLVAGSCVLDDSFLRDMVSSSAHVILNGYSHST
jgi:hypothetical protein